MAQLNTVTLSSWRLNSYIPELKDENFTGIEGDVFISIENNFQKASVSEKT